MREKNGWSTILIKFMDKNAHQQEISAFQVVGAVKLVVTRDVDFVTVSHVNKIGVVMKELNFNTKDVKEFVGEGVVPGDQIVLVQKS